MGVRVHLKNGRTDMYGYPGDGEWTARRDDYSGTLLITYLRAGVWEEVRRFYRPEEWKRVEIN